jgi:hypothetical protein
LQGQIRADGADAGEAQRWEAQAEAEAAVAQAERAVAQGIPVSVRLQGICIAQLCVTCPLSLVAQGIPVGVACGCLNCCLWIYGEGR